MTTARPIPSARRRGPAVAAAAIAVALILAACGGGGGGGGATTFRLRVVAINETAATATFTLDVGGVPGEPQEVESCKGRVLTFDLPADPETWTFTANGEIAIDSATLEDVQRDKNLIAEVILHEDGTVEQESLSIGAGISAPAASGICL